MDQQVTRPQRWAEKYLLTPFVKLGFGLDGCHCWGLVWLVYQMERQISLPKYDAISASQVKQTIMAIRHGMNVGPWQKVEEARPFDVAVMLGDDRNEDGKLVGRIERHVGVMCSSSHVLHVEEKYDTRIADVREMFMAPRMRGIYRYVG